VCAWQRPCQEGSSPSGPRVRRSISERGGNASRAREGVLSRTLNGHEVGNDGNCQGDGPTGRLQLRRRPGGQGVGREAESEGHEEKLRAVIEGATPDEPVGQSRGKVEPALWRRRRSYPPCGPRCVRAARSGRHGRDPGRAGRELRPGTGASRGYKRERSVRVRPSSRRRVAKYLKRRQQNLRDREGDRGGPGKATREEPTERRRDSE
jgi:hypothetical protein